MQFILAAPAAAVAALEKNLQASLETGQKVLWLVSGGSNVPASIQIMQALPADVTTNLTIMPVDERYGEPGHPDSNWQQLIASGFDGKHARLLPVLDTNLGLEQARNHYEELAQKAFAENELCVAQLGMGADGHIAGILPHSPAVQETEQLVAAYQSEPYQRLTLTFPALSQINIAYVLAYGVEKKPALETLKSQDLSRNEQPAQFLKSLETVYLYNDQIGENL